MTEGIWTALIAAMGLSIPASIGGLFRLRRDRDAAQRLLIEEAEERAYTKAQMEARVREAEAALAQKNEELAEKDGLIERLTESLAECVKGERA